MKKHRTLLDPAGPYLINLDKFLDEQTPSPTTDCIIWTGSQNNCGYGLMGAFDVRTDQRRMMTPHRMAFIIHHNRDVLPGMNVNHRCHNRLCVNPLHLFEGTQRQKILDMRDAGLIVPGTGRPRGPRGPYLKKQNRKYRYTEEEIQFVRSGDTEAIMRRFGWDRTKAQRITSRFRKCYRWLPHPLAK